MPLVYTVVSDKNADGFRELLIDGEVIRAKMTRKEANALFLEVLLPSGRRILRA